MDLAQDGNISLVSLLRWYNKHTHQVPGALAGVGKCPFLGILNITFKYLLDPNTWVMFNWDIYQPLFGDGFLMAWVSSTSISLALDRIFEIDANFENL